LFDHLAAGGKYFIEDLHTSYYPTYNGGYRRVGSSIEWLKSFADALHFDHIDSAENIPQKEATYLSRSAKALAKVSFFDSICVVEKLAHEKLRPYRRIFTGEKAQVSDFHQVLTLTPVHQLMNLTYVTPAARQMEQLVLQEVAQLWEREKNLKHRIEECESLIASLREALSRSEAEREQIAQQVASARRPQTSESEQNPPEAAPLTMGKPRRLPRADRG
jgi:DNA gyrase/topoisomerase IV subunit A